MRHFQDSCIIKFPELCAHHTDVAAIYRYSPKNIVEEIIFSDLPNSSDLLGLEVKDYTDPPYVKTILHLVERTRKLGVPFTTITKTNWLNRIYFRKARVIKYKSDLISFISPIFSY